MPLKLYDNSEAVPEALRASAIETKDGKFAVDEPVDPELGDAGKRALDNMKAAKKEEERLRKAAEAELAELKLKADAAARGITEDQLQKIREAEAAKIKPLEEERDQLRTEVRKLKLTDRVQALALRHGVLSARIEDAMLTLERRTDLTDDGVDIVVKDKAGNITTEKVDDFLSKTFKAEKPWLYAGTNASGSGAAGGGSGDDITTPDPEVLANKVREIAGAF